MRVSDEVNADLIPSSPHASTSIPIDQLRILSKCRYPSGNFEEFRKEELEQSIHERFEKQVKRYSDRLAVKTPKYTLSYKELNAAANFIAHSLLSSLGEGEEPVVILLQNDTSAIIGILGVLKAGKIGVYLEPSYPHSRHVQILQDTQTRLILMNNKNSLLAHKLSKNSIQLLNIDEIKSKEIFENPNLSISPDGLAFIIYTSGTTGRPKGVTQNHRNFLHMVMNYTNTLGICAEDRQISFTSPAGIGALWMILRSLLNGAAVFPYDVKEEGIGKLAEWLITEKITIFSALAIFRQFSTILTENHKFPNIRLVTYGGDTVYKKDVNLYKKHFSQESILVIGLGTTETGNVAQYFIDKETEITGDIVPVGYPSPDMEIMLLDDSGNKLGFDRTGEIAIKSRYLSPGYWRMPALSKEKFLRDPDGGDKRIYLVGDVGRLLLDGCLLHLGRKDFQVKVRGYRVEIAEVEKALRNLENIKEVVIVDREDSIGEKTLIAYLVCDTQPAPSDSSLRCALSQQLPDYMIPATFVMLDALPLNPNGKVDRKALPAPDRIRSEFAEGFVAPRDELELQLTKTWEKVLGVHPIGVTDNFFELGGQSLTALRLFAQIEKILGKNLPLGTLFQAPTIEKLAGILREEGWSAAWSSQEAIETVDAGFTNVSPIVTKHVPAKIYPYLKQQYLKVNHHPGYRYLKRQYFRVKNSLNKRFLSYQPSQLEKKLREIGLAEADTVYMHSAFNAFNGFLGGPQQIIDCILNVIGESGNLLMVSMAYTGSTEEYLKAVKTFDVIKTESSMGIITEIFRRKKHVVRSLNPAHPILAFGPDAKWIVSDHDKTMYSCGKDSPFEKILELNAKAFFFDVPLRMMTFFHYLEDRFKGSSPVQLYDDEPLESTVVDSKGNETTVKTYVFSREVRENRNVFILERELKKRKLSNSDRIGNTKLIVANLMDVVACAQDLVNSGIHLYKKQRS
jgi:amino acid adenylation domain-containing protein